jgi:plastocyanin
MQGLAILGVVALVAVGCGGDDAGSGEASGEVVEVATLDNTFDPETLEVEAGTTVRWDNQGRNAHNVTPVDDDGWGVDTDDFEPGATYEFTFADEGTYRYYCTIHGTPTSGQIKGKPTAQHTFGKSQRHMKRLRHIAGSGQRRNITYRHADLRPGVVSHGHGHGFRCGLAGRCVFVPMLSWDV